MTGPGGAPGHRLIVLSGPSGVGKSTVVRELRETHPEVWLSVSVTTRFPRPGEVDGVHYHFVTRAAFEAMVAEGGLLEWAEFAGNLVRHAAPPVVDQLAAGRPVLLEIDLQGARQVRAAMPEALLVFLTPPSWDELVRRLTGRGTEPSRRDRAPARDGARGAGGRGGVRHHAGEHERRGRGRPPGSLDRDSP